LPPKCIEATTFDELAERILDPSKKSMLRILDKHILAQMMVDTIKMTSSPPLADLQSIPLEDSETQEALADEFNEFLRATDAGALGSLLVETAEGLSDPFASVSSIRFAEAFRILEQSLLPKVDALGSFVFLSRSHLSKKAREILIASWAPILEVQEVLISNISVFDAPTLKLVAQIAEIGERREDTFRVRMFLGIGTCRLIKERLEKARIQFKEEKDSQLSSCITENELLDEYAKKGSLRFVATPERRREVETVVERIHELLLQGVPPSDILIVARDCGKYLSLVSEILPAYGISYNVQTRRPYAHLSPYRFVKATLDLLVHAKSGNIDWNLITDPLRLGFCLPGSRSTWPVPSKQFIYLEECLSRIQSKAQGQSLSLSEWRNRADSEVRSYPAKMLLKEFLSWVSDQLASPPMDKREARYLISDLLEQYMLQESTWTRKASSPRISSPGRFNIIGLHPTYFASRIRSDLIQLESHISDCIDLLHQTLSWELIDAAFGEVFGSETYGLPKQDSSSVTVVDAANTAFLRTKHLFILGLRTDEFPRSCPKGIFLSDTLRDAITIPAEGESAFLYLRSRASDYANECDYLETVVRTCPESITCCMPYHDERMHVLEWSSFVEKHRPGENEKNRILPNKWLPVPGSKDWQQTAKRYPPWVRQRLYCYHTHRKFPQAEPPIDNDGIKGLAATIDPEFYSTQLEDRIERYLHPPRIVEVLDDEPWFSSSSLQSIVGPPIRTHEMDLHATCPMQYYFFQFLFLWNGDGIDRDSIPIYYKRGHWRYGKLPARLSYVYPSFKTYERIQDIINHFPNRQDDLGQFSRITDFQNKLRSFLSGYDLDQLGTTFADEWYLVSQEKKDNIRQRQWSWDPGNRAVTLQGLDDVEIMLPPHRIDDLQHCKLIVAYVNFSGQLGSKKSGIVYSRHKGTQEDADDPLRDYRIPILLAHYLTQGNIAAAIYAELFDGKRAGYHNESLLSKHKGSQGYGEELEMPISTSQESKNQVLTPLEWNKRILQFKTAIITRAKKMVPNPGISFEATPCPETCFRCVYNDLCQISRVEGL
jgi:hypothetical protein